MQDAKPTKEQLEHLKLTLDEQGSGALMAKVGDSPVVAKELGIETN